MESHTKKFDHSHQVNACNNWKTLSQANTIHSNNIDLLFVNTYTKETLKERWCLNVRRVISLCVHSAVFTAIVTLKHFNQDCELQLQGCRNTPLFLIVMSCITKSKHGQQFADLF